MNDNEEYHDSTFYDFSKDDNMTLEPRLVEYLRKKKYFQENNIENQNLEKDFHITDKDTIKLRAHFRGDKRGEIKTNDYINTSDSNFPSSKFKHDPRFDRIKKKQEKEEDAQVQRKNYGLINRGFDMYRDDRPFASACGDDFKNTEFHPRQWFENSKDIAKSETWNPRVPTIGNNDLSDSCEEISHNKKSLHESNTYVHPKSIYNGYLPQRSKIENDPHSLDSIIGKLDSYRNKVNSGPTYQVKNQLDLNSKVILPNIKCNNKRETENSYQAVPFMGRNNSGNRDIDVDTFVRLNAGTRNSRSVGYPNPVDHYFNFISDDIQQPDHVVNMRGLPSRLLNKQVARPMTNRDIMP
jgi:hypothetical protein